nr:MAG TPA: hypothetical protein [Caudoviricetes sp.]
MQVHDREVGFRFTVGASAKISDLCPDGDISRLGEVLEGGYGKVVRDTAAIIVAMSEGYAAALAFETFGRADIGGDWKPPRPLTVDEVMTLRMDEFARLQQAALAAWMEDSKPTVEVEPEKKEGGEDQESS